jgi:hypothetical protein
MAINETQLETWSKQGSVTQSKNTVRDDQECVDGSGNRLR